MKLARVALIFAVILLSVSAAPALNIGEQADFSGKTYDGKEIRAKDLGGKVVVLEWFNPGCPFVQKHYKSGSMQALQREYTGKEVVWLTVNSTTPSHRDHLSAEEAAKQSKEWNLAPTAFIDDSSGAIGKQFGAKTTPHMFVLDGNGKLVYRGAIDDDNDPAGDPSKAKNYVRAALDQLGSGSSVEVQETKPYGCSVKY